MRKKEFLTLVKNIREDLKENIDAAISKYREAEKQLYEEYYDKARDYVMNLLKDPEMASLIIKKAIEGGHVNPLLESTWDGPQKTDMRVTGISIQAFLDLKDAPVYPKEKKAALYRQIQTLLKLKREYRRMLDTWKLTAIENKTYNHEPFPLVLYELLSPELRKLLIPGE